MERAVTQSLSKDSIESLKTKIRVPENAKLIGVPKVNPEIWTSLSNRARMTDFRMQQMQQNTMYGLQSLAKIADLISKGQPSSTSFAEIMQIVKDGVTLMGMGHQNLSLRRKYELKQHIQPEYASICTGPLQISEYLFGDNIEDLLKKSKATSELVKKVTPRPRLPISKPYARPSSTNTYTGSLNYVRPSLEQYRRGGQTRGNQRNSVRGFKRGQHQTTYHH